MSETVNYRTMSTFLATRIKLLVKGEQTEFVAISGYAVSLTQAVQPSNGTQSNNQLDLRGYTAVQNILRPIYINFRNIIVKRG